MSVPDAASVKLPVHSGRCITKATKQCRPGTPASAIWMIPMTCLCSHSLMSQSLLQMIPMNECLSQQSSVNPGCPGLLGSGPVTGQHARTIHTLTCLELMRRTLDWIKHHIIMRVK